MLPSLIQIGGLIISEGLILESEGLMLASEGLMLDPLFYFVLMVKKVLVFNESTTLIFFSHFTRTKKHWHLKVGCQK